MKLHIFGVIVVLAITVILSTCQAEDRPLSVLRGNNQQLQIGQGKSLSLLNPNRFSMSQSYSLFFLSNGKKSHTAGFYLNRLIYHFSEPLSLKLEMGYLQNSPLTWRKAIAPQGKLFPAVELLYRPNRNLSISFRYRVLPSPYSYWYRSFYDWADR